MILTDKSKMSIELKKINKVELGVFPTPIHRLSRLEKEFNHDNIWIKRDDLSGLAMGGNKTRTLEYILGDALEKEADTILVSGPLQSNMCTLTAAATRKLGLDCISIHNSEAPKEINGNLTLNSLLDIKPYYIGKLDEDERTQFVEKLAVDLKNEGANPYIIRNGGSTAIGALGFVSAAIELFEQINMMGVNIKQVFMAGGNGGTVAGLIAGTSLLGVPFHINVISVEHPKAKLREIITEVVAEIEKTLGLNISCELDEVMTIYDDYMGNGWGESTEESKDMIYALPKLEGIFVENVYTSKPMVGMLDLIEKKIIGSDEGVCFWHTGGLPSLFAQMKDES
jgi:D-cysteine desulfhydrase family pyridoxal phosphate-dependent enzyme